MSADEPTEVYCSQKLIPLEFRLMGYRLMVAQPQGRIPARPKQKILDGSDLCYMMSALNQLFRLVAMVHGP
jgi:hypothetical protein